METVDSIPVKSDLSNYSLSDWLRLLRRNLVLIIIAALLGLTGGIAAYLLLPKTYASSASVLFPSDSGGLGVPGLENLSLPSGASKGDNVLLSLGLGPQRTPTVDLAVAIFQSRGAAAYVLDELHLAEKMKLPKERDRAIDVIQKNFLTVLKKKPIVTLTTKAPSPALAKLMAEAYLHYYRSYSDSAILTSSKRHRIFVEKQLHEGTQNHLSAEKKVIKFESGTGSTLLGADSQSREKIYSEVAKGVLEAESRYYAAQSRLGYLRRASADNANLANHDSFFPDAQDRVLQDSQSQLSLAEAQLSALRRERTDLHPEVILAREKVEAAHAQVQRRLQSVGLVLNSQLTKEQVAAEAEFRGAQAAYRIALEREKEVRSRARRTPRALLQQHNIQAELAFSEKMEQSLTLELERARIAESAESTSLEVLDAPEEPTHAVFPRLLYFGPGGFLLGLLCGFLYACVRESRRTAGIVS